MAWDFWSLTPESIHQVTILFSDRGTPATYRNMNGYSSHTYSLVNAEGEMFWVKFHFHTDQGDGNAYLSQDEADRLAGAVGGLDLEGERAGTCRCATVGCGPHHLEPHAADRVLGVGDQLGRRIGPAAEILEDLQVARAGMDHACVRARHELVDEIEDLVEGRRASEDPPVGDDANQTRKGERGEREGLESGGKSSQPASVGLVVVR